MQATNKLELSISNESYLLIACFGLSGDNVTS